MLIEPQETGRPPPGGSTPNGGLTEHLLNQESAVLKDVISCACSEFRAAHPAPVEDWSVEEIEQYLDACIADQAVAEEVLGGGER